MELLWTSGWDSTFRLLAALFLEDVTVQPHYIVDSGRASVPVEKRAMDAIREAVGAARPGLAERLLPTLYVELGDVPADQHTAERFAALAARGDIGSQYEWLARYTLHAGIDDLELSIHHDDRAKVYLDGKVELLRREPFASYRLAPDHESGDLGLFANFVFPVFDLTKVDMRDAAARHGFLDILELSWFCHSPRGDLKNPQPCGLCNPCKDAVAEGVGYRLPAGVRLKQRLHAVVPWTKVTKRLFR